MCRGEGRQLHSYILPARARAQRAEHEQKWKEGVHAHKRTERTYRVPVLHCDKGDKLPFRVLVRLGREAVAVSETFIYKRRQRHHG